MPLPSSNEVKGSTRVDRIKPGAAADLQEVEMGLNKRAKPSSVASWRKFLSSFACSAIAGSLLLACTACDGAPEGATQSAVAPGRPGTGNPTVVVAPQPGSWTESPQTGGARALVPMGATGKPGGRRVPGKDRVFQLPGVGLDGGLGGGTPDAVSQARNDRTSSSHAQHAALGPSRMVPAIAPAGASMRSAAAETDGAARGAAASLPAIGISSADLEFMLETARMCNGRIAAAQLVTRRSTDHAARKFAEEMLIDYQHVSGRLHELARERGIALPNGTTRKMADIMIALRGVPDKQVDRTFLRRVGVDAERDAVALFATEAANAQAWPPLRALAQSALPQVSRRLEVATLLRSTRKAGATPPSAAILIPTPG
jgi:predicted outer membrane protein